jgi:uncharacterized protein (TIGR02145 family)
MLIRTSVVTIALGVVCAPAGVHGLIERRAQVVAASQATPPSKRMQDGRQWATTNLDVISDGSYCYGDAPANCRRYGRLYTWEAAQQGCLSVGEGWRLPTNDEWRLLATRYGGLREESGDMGKAAYTALVTGGSSGFEALLGGGREPTAGEYARLEAHGLYWTASETDASTAWVYNFGKGGQSVNRHTGMVKQWAFSVRCIRNEG